MTAARTPKAKTPETPAHRPSFITPEMIEKNPALEVAGLFADAPLWQELREEIRKNRECDRHNEEQDHK